MILSDFFDQVNSAFRGSDDDAPAVGTTDYDLWLLSTNRKLGEWVQDEKQARTSLFAVRNLGTMALGANSFNLPTDALSFSDRVKVTTTAGDKLYYQVVKPQERDIFSSACYISSHNPQTLTFVDDLATGNSAIGGTVSAGGFWVPADLANASDVIPVDDPYWLVYAVAGELSFNDLTYSDKYPELVAKANNLYSQMSLNNRRGTNNNPRTLRTNVQRIPGTGSNAIGQL